MFFQRIFERKNLSDNHTLPTNPNVYDEDSERVTYDRSETRVGIAEHKDNNNNQSASHKMQRRIEQPIGVVQLTPLWEHILRTRRLPDTTCPASMFAEFQERLQAPEWQVRQHALRVLVDVLIVMHAKADKYNANFLIDLIRNLGHQAPTVRKGALDCLRVYLTQTDIPEMVMFQILDTGLSQQPTGMERLSCGVILSLPALLQSILLTQQRNYILKHTIERLMLRLQRQQTQQEIILKVLTKINELLGTQEFESYIDETNGLTLYHHLSKVYGITRKSARAEEQIENKHTGAWRALPREHTWRSNTVAQAPETSVLPEKGKVIMETEIKINDDTLTMRILEADTETEEADDSPIVDRADLVCRPLASAQSHREMSAGILQIISDSEVEDLPDAQLQNDSPNSTPIRSLKRVTFGGEVVKMRTPDSDAASTANHVARSDEDQSKLTPSILSIEETSSSVLLLDDSKDGNTLNSITDLNMTALTLDIPSDNTKPLGSEQSPTQSKSFSRKQSTPVISSICSNASPKRETHVSPVYRSHSTSPVGSSNISPRVPHKQIEVLHNLQRDPDPSPRSSFRFHDSFTTDPVTSPSVVVSNIPAETPNTPNSWEDLDIVNYKTLMDFRSGDWRNRLQGFAQLEKALSSSTNLVLVQPYLDSLLRTLLSSERNCEVAELKRQLLINLISRLPLDNLEKRTIQILSGLCRQGNAGANRVCQALMQRLPAGTIVCKLTSPEFLHAKSSKFRDHALQMSIYSIMTFPATCFDINILSAQVIYAALNRKRRVRQAALEVLAVLADISSLELILQNVSKLVASVDSGQALLEAVKTRLSRLQLPIITPDGAVLYIFHKSDQAGILSFGADVDWITQGEGSASPNALKRRRINIAHKKRIYQENLNAHDAPRRTDSFLPDENLHRHSFHSPPEALGVSRLYNDFSQKKIYGTSVIPSNFIERRLVNKACSDSSMDGRSTDSTTTTCSSGSGSSSFLQLTSCNAGINKRLVRQNSRFPSVKQNTEITNSFMQNMKGSFNSYSFDDSKYNKGSYVPTKTQKPLRMPPPTLQQSKPHQMSEDNKSTLGVNEAKSLHFGNQLETKCKENAGTDSGSVTGATIHPFSVTPERQADNQNDEGSPISLKSTSYSQKSTASAESHTKSTHGGTGKQSSSSYNDKDLESLEQTFSELVVDDIEEETEPPTQEPILRRNESVNSLHSKTESIRTQLEDATPQMSRAQSTKSLVIEEEIESSNSFVVVEEPGHELESAVEGSSPLKQAAEFTEIKEQLQASVQRASSSKKPTVAHDDKAIHSRSMSFDSLYGIRPSSKQGSLDTSTTDTSSHTGSQLENCAKLIPTKVQHTPLKQKSKTSYLLRGQRRVSPVKQAIKMSQTELFPPNMSRFDKPREGLIKTFDQLDSTNWETNMTGLKCIVRLIRFHSDFLDSHMHMTCIQLTRSVRNLRSQVARAACQAATELFTLKYKALELECDDLVCALLHRTADTNRFLRADATRALESMVDYVQPPKVLNILTAKGAQHQNAIVRTTTAKLLFRLVERLGSDRVYAMARENRDKFFMVGANLLLEGSLETRSYAKSLFRALSDHVSYQRMLLEVIPQRTYRNVEKTLRSITR